jgi:hypothetical protein
MRREEVDWRSGDVVFWDLGELDLTQPLASQVDELKEDLAQIAFAGEVILDVGWYPSFNADGQFVVRVVHSSDWDTPLFLERTAEAPALCSCLQRAVEIAAAAPPHPPL